MDFVEICKVYVGKMIMKAAMKIFNSGKICRSYSDLNFGITCFGTQCRNKFFGTRYLHHNPQWPNCSHNNSYIAYFSLRVSETAIIISTAGLKSLVTIVFIDPDFL